MDECPFEDIVLISGTGGAAKDMLKEIFAGILATAIMVAAVFVVPADAAKKEKKQYRSDAPSLDGRITGSPRTCGYDSLLYGSDGVPVGPYCH